MRDDVDPALALLQQTLRRAGALREGATPCGRALPITHAHAHALLILRAEGPMRQQALGGLLGIDKSNVARLCGRMEALGHATQRPDPDDARASGHPHREGPTPRRRAGTTPCSRGSPRSAKTASRELPPTLAGARTSYTGCSVACS